MRSVCGRIPTNFTSITTCKTFQSGGGTRSPAANTEDNYEIHEKFGRAAGAAPCQEPQRKPESKGFCPCE